MGLFSTSNITCNERPSVGRNFRDTISESASPINRFTEKVETRSFDEIFYEADIAIREASNSMNKLWYKSVLESDTVESAIINEANIFSKVIEVIKTIFDAIKRAIASMLRKARAFLQKIFKKKPKSDASDNKDSENTSKDSKADNRNTDKESTPTDKVEEIESKKVELEREKEELQAKLKEVKKNEDKNKKEEPQKAEDSIHASNIDSSKLDSSNKKKQTDEMDGLSISGEELKKRIKETENKLKKVEDELKTAEKETSSNPKPKTSSSSASTSQVKSDDKTSSVNDEILALYNKYISDIEGNWEFIDKCFLYSRDVKNGPKITPYIDLFNVDPNDNIKIDMREIFEKSFSNVSFLESGNSYRSALYIISNLLSDDDETIKKNMDTVVYDNQFAIEKYRKELNSNTTISDKEKNSIVSGFVENVRSIGSGLRLSFIESSKLSQVAPAWKNLDNALKGGEIEDGSGTAKPPIDISVSELAYYQESNFLNNIRAMKKNNSCGVLKTLEDGLKSIDDAKNIFTKKANFIMNEINSRIKSFSKDSYQYYSSEFIPVIQKALCDSISSVASVVNQVYSTRVKIFTEAFSKGNAWFEACLKLCIAAKLASKKK